MRQTPRPLVLVLVLVLVLGSAWVYAGVAQQPVQVPLGLTDLLADPACTVGYQRFGEEAHLLGWRWTGYDPESGVYFVPEAREESRQQVFMHCPWVKGTGAAFADYRLRLPETTRIALDLQIAMRESAPNSDGVTYRVRADGEALWETLCAWKRWRDFSVDLSRFAGREVTLRLEVDPGPKRTPTDDWSLWGKVEVAAGTDAELAAAREQREKERAERRRQDFLAAARRAEADLSPFARGDVRTSRPSTAGPVRNTLAREGTIYVFTCKAGDETVEYRFRPEAGLLAGLEVRVDGKTLDPAPFAGGPRVLLGEREYGPGARSLSCRLVDAKAAGDTLTCRYEYRREGAPEAASLTARLRAEGKSLALSVEGEAGRFAGFAAQPAGSALPMPWAVGCSPHRHPQGVFLTAFADLWRTDASGLGAHGRQWQTSYHPLTDGTRRPLRDTFALTVSSRLEETLGNVANAPSPYLKDLAGRVLLDAWGGSFAENEAWLREMARYGVDRLMIIKHVWQRDGYDRTYPNVMPANAGMGGDEGLRRLSQTARDLGHRFCVHENFYDYYPNAEAFREEDCALSSHGKTIPGWDNGSVVAWILKPSKLMEYARRFTPDVFRRYAPDAAYHDIMPTWHQDWDARVPGSGIIRRTHEYTRELCDFDRKLFGGPVLFEGVDPLISGIYDGGCNWGLDTYRIPPMVLAELLKVHPKMSNHGIGYYERWLPWGYGAGWNTYVMTDRELDRYRATQVAFGRTGFIGQQLMKHAHAVVREYHLMQAFARAYTGRELRRLAYCVEDPGAAPGEHAVRPYMWIDAATAARYGEWHRVRATYDGGHEVTVNLSEKPWEIAGRTLPPGGSLTTGPRATACTAVTGGQIADYAAYDDVIYADARSHQWLPDAAPDPVTPALGAWKDHGDGSFDLTVEWQVGRKLERNYGVFWHFKEGHRILFQSDHAPATPTTQWKLGEKVKDGPRRVPVRDDQKTLDYDVVVGLHHKEGRAPLAYGADQMHIATLRVERMGGKVTQITLEPAEALTPPGGTREPYLEGANREKRVVDFGPVATNGAVVVRKMAEGREIVPVPAGEGMRVGLKRGLRRAVPFDAAGKALPELPVRAESGKHWIDIPPGTARVVEGR